MPIKGPRDANPRKTIGACGERTQLRNEGDQWKYIGFLLVQRNSFLATWTTYNDVCPAYQTEDRDLYKRLYKAFASIHI